VSRRSRRDALVSGLAAALLALAACSHSQKSSGPPPTVVLQAAGRTVRVEVEVMRTPEERSRGMMYRRELAAYRGMLFIFDEEEQQSFWMKNTYIPLDMVFINGRLAVVGVVENAEPMTTTSRSVAAPSRYVLEVNGGFARRHGIRAGTPVRLEDVALP
jgi:uncharacterized membrane protein (UPF0127 family)